MYGNGRHGYGKYESPIEPELEDYRPGWLVRRVA